MRVRRVAHEKHLKHDLWYVFSLAMMLSAAYAVWNEHDVIRHSENWQELREFMKRKNTKRG